MAFTRPKASQINFDVTNITDPLIRLNSGQTGSPSKDVGLVIERGDSTNAAIIYDESANEFAVINTTETGTTSGNVTIASYAGLQANAIVYGSLNDGTTTLTSTVEELNLLDGVTGTLVTEAGTQTLSNKTLTDPKIPGYIADSNGNELIKFTTTAGAKNEITITNAAIGSDPTIAATGSDTNIDLQLNPKGSGNVLLGNFTFDADQTVGSGQDNYVLTYDDSAGHISLEAASGGGGGGVSTGKSIAMTILFG